MEEKREEEKSQSCAGACCERVKKKRTRFRIGEGVTKRERSVIMPLPEGEGGEKKKKG